MALLNIIRSAVRNEQSNFPDYGISKNNLPLSYFSGTHRKLSDSPEIIAGVNVIADHVSRMTIRLMENTDKGDVRVHNELSRTLDIHPNEYLTRKSLIYAITSSLLLYGNQVSIPIYDRNKLKSIHPIPKEDVEFFENKTRGYYLKINGRVYQNHDVLHLTLNPTSEQPYVGTGYRVPLKDLLDTLKSASNMKRVYMGGKYTPPIIVSVDADSKKMRSREGRQEIIDEYIDNQESGTPWLIPSNLMTVSTVKPITLSDVAVNETIQLDKKTVAAILGIPAFLLGVGEWNEKEFNNFIETKVASIAEIIQQEWTRKLVLNEKQYIKFNARSLKSYDIKSTADWARDLMASGTISRNEVRDLLGFDPKDGFDEILILENYLPSSELGNQKKLKDKEEG